MVRTRTHALASSLQAFQGAHLQDESPDHCVNFTVTSAEVFILAPTVFIAGLFLSLFYSLFGAALGDSLVGLLGFAALAVVSLDSIGRPVCHVLKVFVEVSCDLPLPRRHSLLPCPLVRAPL